MRVSTESRQVLADPGTSPEILVTVVNTGTIIDGVSARVIGAGSAPVRSEPAMLPLFPDAEGRIAVSLDLPETQPAGTHPLTVEVVSHTTGAVEHADLDLEVGARPSLTLQRHPRMIRARRSGRFVLEVTNRGNVPLDVDLSVSPADDGVSVRIAPDSCRVEPGTSVRVMTVVRGPRMIAGAELDRTVTIDLVARRAGLLGPAAAERVEAEPEPELLDSTTLQLRQRPMVARGLLTFLVLACIVGLWAAAFLLGLGQVFKGDPITKTAPASFFTDEAGADSDGGGADGSGGSGGGEEGGGAGGGADAQPPGTLPKDGLMPPGSGGEISGTVTARSDGTPVGRILVEAFRTGAEGKVERVSSGATQADGTYTLAALFPRSYILKFTAEGFTPVWYRAGTGAPAPGKAEEVPVEAQSSSDGVDVVVTGKEASLSGKVDPGDVANPGSVPTEVVARLLSSSGDRTVAARDSTDGSGAYQLPGLTAPGSYEISFVAPGYRVTTVTQRLDGGENRIQPTVLLSADGGVISGVVRDQDGPLGGVTVTTTVAGSPVSVVTPTSGTTGAFSFQNLPTPGTYVITVTGTDHGTTTAFVSLDAGESDTNTNIVLAQGTGTIRGVVRAPGGSGLGGVTVTVGGAPAAEDGAPLTTTTLTTGDVGSFAINGLPVPGSYTVTFSHPGYDDETRPVALDTDGPASKVDFTMSRQLGSVTGAVTDPTGALHVGATVTATNGHVTATTTSSGKSATLPRGGYLFRGLKPGWYSVTVSMEGFRATTALVRIGSGEDEKQDLRLRRVRG